MMTIAIKTKTVLNLGGQFVTADIETSQ